MDTKPSNLTEVELQAHTGAADSQQATMRTSDEVDGGSAVAGGEKPVEPNRGGGALQPDERLPDKDGVDPDAVVITKLAHGSGSYHVGAATNSGLTRRQSGADVIALAKEQSLDPNQPTVKDIRDVFHSGRPRCKSLSKSVAPQPVPTSHGISSSEAAELLELHGPNELVEKVKPKWKLFLEQFTAPMPIGIWLAIVVELALGNILDSVVLLCLQIINGITGFVEANKAGNAVAALKATLKPTSTVKRDGKWVTLDARELVPGDCVLLAQGAAIPADCQVNDGVVSVDQSAITGESLPVSLSKGMHVRMGSTVARGEVEATVIATGMNTYYGKTAALLQIGGDGLADLDKMLLWVVVSLLAFSLMLCSITLVYLLVNKQDFSESLEFVVVLMVASIPIAIELVVTATLALGSCELSQHHAIVANLSSIERLAGIDILCSDKTGTLTLNRMVVQQECPVFKESITRDDVLMYAALAAKWKEPAKDALDTMILGAADLAQCDKYQQLEYVPFDAELKRTEATVLETATGNKFSVCKGAPHVLLEMCADKEVIRVALETAVLELAGRGIRTLAVAQTGPDSEWHMLGLLTFLDPPREDAKQTIAKANQYDVDVKMITGDHELVARETAKALELGSANIVQCTDLPNLELSKDEAEVPDTLGRDYEESIMSVDGFAQALPVHKYVIVEALKQAGHVVGMTGDGVNDAPALKVASVGVAVEGSTDAARAAADIILTKPGLNAIIEAIIIARRIFARMHAFLVYRIAATLQLLTFFFAAIMCISPRAYNVTFPEFWSMPVVSLIVITVLNDGTIVSIAYDRAKASTRPLYWNMAKLWTMSIVLGSVACASSLLLLYLALQSDQLEYGEIIAMMYLKVSLSDFMTLFTARTGDQFFFKYAPSRTLLGAGAIACSLSTIMALWWPFPAEPQGGMALPSIYALYVWIYCILSFLVQDVVKVGTLDIIERFIITNLSSTLMARSLCTIETIS